MPEAAWFGINRHFVDALAAWGVKFVTRARKTHCANRPSDFRTVSEVVRRPARTWDGGGLAGEATYAGRRTAPHRGTWSRGELVGVGHRRTDLAGQGHGLERRGHDLHGAGTLAGIRRLCFEQFRVRENHPELVVEPMNEGPKLVLTRL